MARLGATIAGIALALSIAGPVAAKAKRAVVLLDFSRPMPSPTVSVRQSAEELTAASRAMASQFTGAPVNPAYSASGVVLPTAGLGLRSLGNPFLARSAIMDLLGE